MCADGLVSADDAFAPAAGVLHVEGGLAKSAVELALLPPVSGSSASRSTP
ncbi:hypothetical protein O1Q96_00025 (plasmid) [Streptomyces sp. Qhu-G9]|nr:hypothetical protein [Streptomyces aurantiacus]WAU78278.1 hypothetical protein O1Q96_00025 [Streptomyces aurantiacus]